MYFFDLLSQDHGCYFVAKLRMVQSPVCGAFGQEAVPVPVSRLGGGTSAAGG